MPQRSGRFLMWCSVSVALGACGDDGPGIVDADPPVPGTITVVATGVTGAQGRLLITEARAADGRQAAIACTPIDADPFAATVVLETVIGPTPCEDSSPITLAPGTYSLLTAVLQGGSTTPDACARATAAVDGDVTVTMPALGAC